MPKKPTRRNAKAVTKAKPVTKRKIVSANKSESVAEIVENLDDQQRAQIVQTLVKERVIEETFIGPIPRPDHFAKYEATLPGAAHRILSLTEKEQQIRSDGQDGILTNERKRIHSATLLGLALIVVAGIATWKEIPAVAILLGLTGIFSLVLRLLSKYLLKFDTERD